MFFDDDDDDVLCFFVTLYPKIRMGYVHSNHTTQLKRFVWFVFHTASELVLIVDT